MDDSESVIKISELARAIEAASIEDLALLFIALARLEKEEGV